MIARGRGGVVYIGTWTVYWMEAIIEVDCGLCKMPKFSFRFIPTKEFGFPPAIEVFDLNCSDQ